MNPVETILDVTITADTHMDIYLSTQRLESQMDAQLFVISTAAVLLHKLGYSELGTKVSDAGNEIMDREGMPTLEELDAAGL